MLAIACLCAAAFAGRPPAPLLGFRHAAIKPRPAAFANPAWQRGSIIKMDASTSSASALASPEPIQGETALRATAFIFVLGISLTTLTPAPHLVGALGQENGMKLLTALAATSAATEIALSPIIGGLTDSLGRKPVLVGTLISALAANAAAAIAPSVATVALAKFVGGAVIGIFFLASGAILADAFRTDPKKLAAASGVLFALVNGGFGIGIALSGLLPPGLRSRYLASTAVCLAGVATAALGVRESMPSDSRVAFKARAFNPFAFTRLLRAGPVGSPGRRTMRLLALLAALTLAPLFMGDTCAEPVVVSTHPPHLYSLSTHPLDPSTSWPPLHFLPRPRVLVPFAAFDLGYPWPAHPLLTALHLFNSPLAPPQAPSLCHLPMGFDQRAGLGPLCLRLRLWRHRKRRGRYPDQQLKPSMGLTLLPSTACSFLAEAPSALTDPTC